jgi:hypothetical protein
MLLILLVILLFIVSWKVPFVALQPRLGVLSFWWRGACVIDSGDPASAWPHLIFALQVA